MRKGSLKYYIIALGIKTLVNLEGFRNFQSEFRVTRNNAVTRLVAP